MAKRHSRKSYRKSRKGSRKSRKGSRKSRKGSRKSRKSYRRSRKGSRKSRKSRRKSRKSHKRSKVVHMGKGINCKSFTKNKCGYNPNCHWVKKRGCSRRKYALRNGAIYHGPVQKGSTPDF